MLWQHAGHPRARVRLAYCLNLHPAEDLEQMLAGMRAITLPLRDRLARKGELFGAGLYLPASLARHLAEPDGERDLERVAEFVAESRLDPFTYNAFPAGGFHASGLKAGVFAPTWMEEERVRFTLDVARVAARLARGSERSHVSISTHTGAFAAQVRGEEDAERCAENMALAARELHDLQLQTGVRCVLALEAEPRALCEDQRALEAFRARPQLSSSSAGVHLGTCLDTCHTAVEFEEPAQALASATSNRGVLGKLQFSSALALRDPARNEQGRGELLSMDEPRYLHQVTGLSRSGRTQVDDLPDLARALDGEDRQRWLACDEWRCHFHVPVDLGSVGDHGLTTTRDHADRVLDAALADPSRWGVDELHLEIETYTWDVLPGPACGPGSLVDGLEREYAHVIGRLEAAGWRREPVGVR